MPALTPQFLFSLEDSMQTISENEMVRLAATGNLWWHKVAKKIPSGSRREILSWVLATAQLESQGELGGNIAYDDVTIIQTEATAEFVGKGLKLRRAQFEDFDGNGIQLATEWAQQIGAQAAYWPQKAAAKYIANGTANIGYDGKAFFATDHPLNPKDVGKGTFSNLFTGVAIDKSVSVDTALTNLSDVYSRIRSIKMPNGTDPRYLKPSGILVPPAMFPRVVQLTNAKFIAQAAASLGAGGSDVEALVSSLGYGQPIEAPEFAGTDTTYYVIVEQIAGSRLGALGYVEREQFATTYYHAKDGANVDLSRAEELEWHHKGRNVVAPGHPYMLFKCSG